MSSEIDNDFPANDPYLFFNLINRLRNTTHAVFGEVTVPLSPQLSVLAGGRYTWEKQGGTGLLELLPLFLPDPLFPTAASIKSTRSPPNSCSNTSRRRVAALCERHPGLQERRRQPRRFRRSCFARSACGPMRSAPRTGWQAASQKSGWRVSIMITPIFSSGRCSSPAPAHRRGSTTHRRRRFTGLSLPAS